MEKKTFRATGIVLMVIGALIFVYLGLLSVWGEVEATFFDAALRSDEPLRTLKCPALITAKDSASISGRFNNPTDKPIELEIRTYITEGYVTLMNEFIKDISIQPGETGVVEIPIFPEDAAYGRIIMVRMHQMKEVPLPYLNASCGVIVINTSLLTGTQYLILMIALGVIMTAGGITLWASQSKPLVQYNLSVLKTLIIFAFGSLMILVTGLLDWWIVSIIISVAWISMGAGMVWQFSNAPKQSPNQKQE
jgi:hypothetical protein